MFVDSSILIVLMAENGGASLVQSIVQRIRDEEIFISIIQLGELSDWALRHGIEVDQLISKIRTITTSIPLSERIILKGSRVKFNRRTDGFTKFSLIDGLIFASALELNERLLTLDTDFRDLENVMVLSE